MPRRGWHGLPPNVHAIEQTLADPALYIPARKAEVVAANARLAAIKKLAAAAEADWLAAEEALEAAL